MGAGDRRGTVRVLRRRVVAAVDARAVAAALLAQDGRGGRGGLPDRRRIAVAVADSDPGPRPRRPRPARRVIRPGRVVAVASPGRHARGRGGRCGSDRDRARNVRRVAGATCARRAGRPIATAKPASRDLRGAHRPRRGHRVGRARGARPAERSHPERVPSDPARGARPDRAGARPAPHPSTHPGGDRRTGPHAGGRPEGDQLRGVHALQPAVRPTRRHDSARERDRDAALAGRWHRDEADRGRHGGRHRRTGRPADAFDAAPDPACGRQSPLGAAGGRGARCRGGAPLGARR